jgi:hypothetical protein
MRRTLLVILSLSVLCTSSLAGNQFGVGRKVTPCRHAPRSVPITRSCVAAAIAEEAYLEARHHQVERYVLYLHGKSSPEWRFLIEQGDETHPASPDSHWFVRVDRATGKAQAIPGVL